MITVSELIESLRQMNPDDHVCVGRKNHTEPRPLRGAVETGALDYITSQGFVITGRVVVLW